MTICVPKPRPSMHDQDMDIIREAYFGDIYQVAVLPSPIKLCIDIGAHIGSFACKLHEKEPDCEILCVEPNPANIDALQENTCQFALTLDIAITQLCPTRLMNTAYPGTANSGGTFVETKETLGHHSDRYHPEDPPRWLTFNELLYRLHGRQIDLVKMDCEGCEYAILENTRNLYSVNCWLGEWHGGHNRFWDMVYRKFDPSDWYFDVLQNHGDLGIFRLAQKSWVAKLCQK